MEVALSELKKAVEGTHRCQASFLEAVPVSESFQGKPVWRGVVHIFEIKGHPTASKCYAWSHEVEGTKKRRFFAVLQAPPINTPQDAVKAAIVQEYRTKSSRAE